MASQDELNLSANVRAAVQKHSALSSWSSVAVNTQVLESLVNPTKGIPALMSARGTKHKTKKPTFVSHNTNVFVGCVWLSQSNNPLFTSSSKHLFFK